MLKKVMAAMLVCMVIAGCAGRAANPVQVRQVGDNNLSCAQIHGELRAIDASIRHLVPQADKKGRNFALGMAGFFVWPAWFFMDLTDSEQQEIDAYRARYQYLLSISEAKQCKLS